MAGDKVEGVSMVRLRVRQWVAYLLYLVIGPEGSVLIPQ